MIRLCLAYTRPGLYTSIRIYMVYMLRLWLDYLFLPVCGVRRPVWYLVVGRVSLYRYVEQVPHNIILSCL